jgi:hypothetical protein
MHNTTITFFINYIVVVLVTGVGYLIDIFSSLATPESEAPKA